MLEQIINARKLKETLQVVMERKAYDKVFILTDTTTQRLCLPLLGDTSNTININIGVSEKNKSLSTLEDVLSQLVENHATRHSLMINLGGGIVTDLGGFTSAIFKRGIDYVNIPTTLLAMVDAGVGGKTGINFNGLKNELGVFKAPMSVLINTEFLKTLDRDAILSGYGEVIKHALLDNEQMWEKVMATDPLEDISNNDLDKWQQLIYENVKVKARYVDEDPWEQGVRKSLNFGHTFGHAFESISYRKGKGLSHGYAVAYGMICELYLSVAKLKFPAEKMRQTVNYIKENYGNMDLECNDYDEIKKLMRHDKKNIGNEIRPVLMKDIGRADWDCSISEEEIDETLDFFREGL